MRVVRSRHPVSQGWAVTTQRLRVAQDETPGRRTCLSRRFVLWPTARSWVGSVQRLQKDSVRASRRFSVGAGRSGLPHGATVWVDRVRFLDLLCSPVCGTESCTGFCPSSSRQFIRKLARFNRGKHVVHQDVCLQTHQR